MVLRTRLCKLLAADATENVLALARRGSESSTVRLVNGNSDRPQSFDASEVVLPFGVLKGRGMHWDSWRVTCSV